MTTNDIATAQEALAYLREEAALSQATPTAPATKAERAVARIFDTTRDAFLASFDWSFARAAALPNATVSLTDTSTWPALARSAFALALARDLAVIVTGRQDDLKTVAALLSERMRAARLADVSATLDSFCASCAQSQADHCAVAARVMRRVLPLVAADDSKPVPFSFQQLSGTVVEASEAAAEEVRATLGATGLDALAFAAAEVLAASRVAPVMGLGTEYAQLRLAEYKEKVLEWRKVAMDAALRASDDPALAELVANEGDDAAKVRAFETYQSRVAAVRPVVRDALLAAHHWSFARATAAWGGEAGLMAKPGDCVRAVRVLDARGRAVAWGVKGDAVWAAEGAAMLEYTARREPESWPGLAREAYFAAVAARLARAAGSGSRETLEKLAEARLRAAKVADLNEDGSGSGLVREVKNVLKAEFRMTDADLDESADALTVRIADLAEGARAEVMAAHNWHFAHASCTVAADDGDLTGVPGGVVFQRPAGAARITGVRGADGGLAEWSVRDGRVFVRGESAACGGVFEVLYMRDDVDVGEWPENVRRALVYRIAADAAATVPRRDKDASLMLELYRQKLQAAKVADAREGNPGRSAWGRGGYVEAFRGGRRAARDGRRWKW